MPPLRPRHPGPFGYEPDIAVVGQGPPLVSVPEMDGTGKLICRQAPRLARRFRVATYALRDDAVSMDPLVSHLRIVVRSLSPSRREPAVVVGESFGEIVADRPGRGPRAEIPAS